MLEDQYHEELRALRDLERTVRAYSVTSTLVSQQRRADMLAVALRAVVDARKATTRKSGLPASRKSPPKVP
ncbi:hypothetical protein [Noviherbaspirillum galbum]|uniref:Uncharacterized protein n=1 Tax=Noviherbaspirillum galbum TaxID=2709383 RepID=A0A6B3SRN1_9BURK|nr:hypothetical protein [Noviherbaspirillum galbum]NEX63590.1 hypothetical protein [Noviherbaspirillum galbum]